jgi:hypothetical protein
MLRNVEAHILSDRPAERTTSVIEREMREVVDSRRRPPPPAPALATHQP